MPGTLFFTAVFLIITGCSSQDTYPKPIFPNVFQTEIEGTFTTENRVVDMVASMFFDRENNRAALFVTREADLTKQVYNFDDDEILAINDNDCEVQQIPDEQGFFPFKKIGGKKKMSTAEEALFFTNSKLESKSMDPAESPILIYKANIDIPQYGKSNCEIKHFFSKPELELWTCRDGEYCNSTLITLNVKCKDKDGKIDLSHVYRFSRFVSQIEDESVFLPPPGIHCDMKNKEDIPPFPPYFSFTFDMIEKPGGLNNDALFNTHKEVWYDSENRIIRTDEFGMNGLLYSSRIFDIKSGVAFTIIATEPGCVIGPIDGPVELGEITRLPKYFFSQNESVKEVYVGKRKVHGLDYDVWSNMWTDSDSEARIVEEMYFLQIVPSELSDMAEAVKSVPQLSHADMYTYEMNDEEGEYQLAMLKHYSINNFRSEPKEWAAFDVATCFKKEYIKEFALKVEAPPIVKGSHTYRKALELLYNKIIEITGVSVVRISELAGIFEGVKLVEMRGRILDNAEATGWPKSSKEPRMEETLKLIQKAATDKKLSVRILENNKPINIRITSVDTEKPPASNDTKSCFSGGSMAAASLALLVIGIFFGVAGYYVFLKKRRPSNNHVKMSNLNNSI